MSAFTSSANARRQVSRRRAVGAAAMAGALSACGLVAHSTPLPPGNAGDAGDAADLSDTSTESGEASTFACGVYAPETQWCTFDRTDEGYCDEFENQPLPLPFTDVQGDVEIMSDPDAPSGRNVLRTRTPATADVAYADFGGIPTSVSLVQVRFLFRVDATGNGAAHIAELAFLGASSHYLSVALDSAQQLSFVEWGDAIPNAVPAAIGKLSSCAWHELEASFDFVAHAVQIAVDGSPAVSGRWIGASGTGFAIRIGVANDNAGAWTLSFDDAYARVH